MLWWTLRQLKSKDYETRERAAEKLGKSGNARAVKPLIAILNDSDNSLNVRRDAARALGAIGDARAVEPLIIALKDSAWNVRRSAAEALRALKYEPADQSQQALMLVAFEKCDDAIILGSAAVEPLIIALKDSKRFVRRDAAKALGAIGDARAVEPLIIALKDSDKDTEEVVRTTAEEALVKIGSAAVDPLIIALKDSDGLVRHFAARALGEIGDGRAVEPLIAALKDSSYAAVGALGALGDVRAVEPLIAALKDSDLCDAAARALGEIGDARAVKPLIIALKDSKFDFSHMHTAASYALVKIGDVCAVKPLIVALKDSKWFVRRSAARALEALKYEPTDQSQQALMLVALQKWGDAIILGSAAVEPLIIALKDSKWDVRRDIAIALGAIGDGRAVEPLIAVLKKWTSHDSDSAVHSAASHALVTIGDACAVEPCIDLATSNVKCASDALNVIEGLLKQEDVRRKISNDVLMKAAELQKVSVYYKAYCAENSHFSERDCSNTRQLARQELIRRGAEA